MTFRRMLWLARLAKVMSQEEARRGGTVRRSAEHGSLMHPLWDGSACWRQVASRGTISTRMRNDQLRANKELTEESNGEIG